MEQLASETGQTLDTVEPGLAMILWMDVLMSLFFVGAVSLGIANRNHPMVHKRLMFFAGLVYLFAATSRVGGTLGLLLDMELGPAPGFVLLLALSLALPIHDRRKLGKIPKTTWLCFCLYWLAILLSVVLGNIEWGENLVFSIFKST